MGVKRVFFLLFPRAVLRAFLMEGAFSAAGEPPRGGWGVHGTVGIAMCGYLVVGADVEVGGFLGGRYDSLLRTARLLVDRRDAEDLTQASLVKTFVRWHTLRDPLNAEAYTRAVMVRLAIRAGRRRWRGEVPTDRLPERPAADVHGDI